MTDPITFAAVTPKLALPNLFVGQAQKEFFVNEALARIDGLLHCAIEAEVSDPPATPAVGDCWIVGEQPSGAWTECAECIASWQSGGWLFTTPKKGMRVFDRAGGVVAHYANGWQRAAAVPAPTGGSIVDAEARDAISGLIAALRQAGILSQD